MGTVEKTATPFSPADLAKLEALRKSMTARHGGDMRGLRAEIERRKGLTRRLRREIRAKNRTIRTLDADRRRLARAAGALEPLADMHDVLAELHATTGAYLDLLDSLATEATDAIDADGHDRNTDTSHDTDTDHDAQEER